jgi:hypothetical protein
MTNRAILENLPRPEVRLAGEDGNAFAIMGRCVAAARRVGWTKEQTDALTAEMMSGDYNHLLRTAVTYFDDVGEDHRNELYDPWED